MEQAVIYVVVALLGLSIGSFLNVVIYRLPRRERSAVEDLQSLPVKSRSGRVVPISALGRWIQVQEDKTIYHKNLERIVYVFAEVAGRAPAEAIIDIQADRGEEPEPAKPAASEGERWAGHPLAERSYHRNGGGVQWSVDNGNQVN